MSMMLMVAVGFSIGMSGLLALALASTYRKVELPWPARIAGYVMLAALAFTQYAHSQLALGPPGGEPTRAYVIGLFAQSLGFYWLLLGVLRRDAAWRAIEWMLPVLALGMGLITPLRWGVPVALLMGTGFAAHLAVLLYRLRPVRRWFMVELPVVALFGVMGAAVAIAGVAVPRGLDWSGFAQLYAVLIAVGYFLVGWLLLTVPDLVPKTREAVAASYAQSTLGKIDQDAAARRLRELFEVEHVYRDVDLGLSRVAELMGLSTHQLSELVNTRFQIGFSRFVRQYRVEAARRMLLAEPSASVLSVGLSVGFSSQSSFIRRYP
jgi:AraC-like DNA-binding protein